MAVKALHLHPRDDVANVLAHVEAGGEIEVFDTTGQPQRTLVARDNIALGHKVAMRDLAAGELVHKYGQPIGRLMASVMAGRHVHTHNLTSLVGHADTMAPRGRAYPAGQLSRFIEQVAQGAGASAEAARHLADALVEADLRGVETHGLRRLAPYIARIRSGAVDGQAMPLIVARESVLSVDGRNAIGHHVGTVTADALVTAARAHGVALALVRDSNHFGFAGYYATRIAASGMAAIVTSNGTPCVAPSGGIKPFLSNDPLAIAMPLDDGTFIELDLATSVVSRARLNQALERGFLIPEGWALGPDGRPTRDPATGLEGSLLPMGGERGFALLFALELLAGILPGGASADQVAAKDRDDRPEGTSHFLLAISLANVPRSDSVAARVRNLIERMRAVPRLPHESQPRYPGERRWQLRRERLVSGIPLDPITASQLRSLAQEQGVRFPDPPEEV